MGLKVIQCGEPEPGAGEPDAGEPDAGEQGAGHFQREPEPEPELEKKPLKTAPRSQDPGLSRRIRSGAGKINL